METRYFLERSFLIFFPIFLVFWCMGVALRVLLHSQFTLQVGLHGPL